MSWKRKASQDPPGKAKRPANQLPADAPKSARSAFLANQNNAGKESPLHNDASSSIDLVSGTSTPSKSNESTTKTRKPMLRPADAYTSNDCSEDSSSSDEEVASDKALDNTGCVADVEGSKIPESQFPQTWKRTRELIAGEILSQRLSGVRILVTGTVGSGKMTFAKYLINSLLAPPESLALQPFKSVAVLDLDPTRATYGPPGHVALFMVNEPLNEPSGFIEVMKTVQRCIPVGLYGQREDPGHFHVAVNELLRSFQQLHTSMPLLIFCPSFERESDRGMDRRTLQALIRTAQANHICCISSKASHVAEAVEAINQSKGPDSTTWEMETLDARAQMTIAQRRSKALRDYFHGSLESSRPDIAGCRSLGHYKPYAISYIQTDGGQTKDILGCFVFGDLPPNHSLMMSRILNGSVVSIAILHNDTEPDQLEIGQTDHIPYFVATDGSNPNPSMLRRANTIGFGLIHSIQRDFGVMYIIAPDHVARRVAEAPPERVILVHGVADSPDWAYADDLEFGSEPCYIGKARKGMRTLKSRRFKKRAGA
ncbi:uncharacterized protein PV09_08109 [Verruconis gallopava]|uniref:Polynucleotide 5'-hydroxyl-kinase GRC3 n=1 Tax=Verruconis gallopava TaxID=253628 RepID=A0A0D2A252_9PEZI|nr:uncharacterized protein PV09_08109 [Verruconis gallopava]KIW00400.1 hypothetical protein PV09_08109 [Verruconis gallopava]